MTRRRRGIFEGDAILWPDGTHSRASPHQSVIIGGKSSVVVGKGVSVGQGKGAVPLDDPNAPNKTRCAVLEGISYCYRAGCRSVPRNAVGGTALP